MTSEVVRHHIFRFKMVAKPKSLRCYRDPYTLVPFSNVKVLKFALDGLSGCSLNCKVQPALNGNGDKFITQQTFDRTL